MKRRDAFTLVELLVLVAILAVVGVLLLPALGGARELSSRAACANNLRQIGLGMLAYSEDYKGFFPTCRPALDGFADSNWNPNCAGPYGNGGATQFYQALIKNRYIPTTKVFVCPSDKESVQPAFFKVFVAASWDHQTEGSVLPMKPWNKSYFYVSRLNSRRGSKPYLLMADDSYKQIQGSNPVAPDVESRDNHGTAGRNALFSDGHVQWINGPNINPYFQTIQEDYDAFGLHVEVIN